MPWRTLLMGPVCRTLHLGGAATGVVGGLLAANVPEASSGQAAGGLALAFAGVVTAVATAWFNYKNDEGKRKLESEAAQREERRQIRVEKGLKAKLDAAQVEIGQLQTKLAEVPANAGKIDAALGALKESGWIQPPPSENAPPGTSFPKILVLEDDPVAVRAWTAILTRNGWEVLSAGTVEEAIARLDARPSAALLDLTLPDGPGEAVLEAIRGLGLQTRVVVASGIADAARLAKVRADYGLTPQQIMAKPVDLRKLLGVLQPHGSNDEFPVYRDKVVPVPGPAPVSAAAEGKGEGRP